MKHIKLFSLMFIALISFVSCSDDDSVADSTASSSDYVYADFSFGGDFKETELPLARTDSKKVYYAIDIREVFTYTETLTGHQVTRTDYNPYAYGLFTSVDNMRVQLKKGQEYRIFSTILKEREDTVYHEGNWYFYPFTDIGQVELKNKFFIDKNIYINLDNHEISIDSKYGRNYVRMDRYFGCDDVTPVNDKNTINLNLKRFNFGLKLVITPPVDGSIEVDIPSLKYNHTIYSYQSTYIEELCHTTATSTYHYKDNPDYAESITLNFIWLRSDGSKETYEKVIYVKRNTLKTLNVNLSKRDYESGFEFNIEDVMNEETEEIN